MTKILAIDDKRDNLFTLEAIGKELLPECKFILKQSGIAGIISVQEDKPDVVLLDLKMPKMNGFEVCEKLKSNPKTKHIPIIILSASFTDSKSKVKALHLGADAFLTKPIDPSELVAQINAMLRIKKAEDKLREENIILSVIAKEADNKFDFTQRKYQNVFDNNIAGIVETTLDGKIISCNTALAHMFGFESIEEILAKKTMHFYKSKSDRDKVTSILKKNKELINYEVDFVDKKGKTINTLIRCFNIENKSILTFIIDITESKRAEESLRQSERKFRQLFEESPVPLWEEDIGAVMEHLQLLKAKGIKNFRKYFDENEEEVKELSRKMIILDVNKASVKLFKSDSKKNLMTNLTKTFTENSFRMFKEEIIEIAEGKIELDFETELKTLSGETIFVILNLKIGLKDPKTVFPTLTRAIVSMKDITDRKIAEYKIRESQQRLTSHLDNTPLAGIFWNIDFRVTDWNKSAERIFGFKKEEALGKHYNEIITPVETQNTVDELLKHLLSQTRGKRSTINNITKDGKKIVCDWYNVAITDIENNVTGVASLVDDITERKQSEQKLRFQEQQLKLIYDSVGDIIYYLKVEKDSQYRFISVNKAFLKATGLNEEQIVDKYIEDVIPENSIKLVRYNYSKAIKEKNIVYWEETSKYPKGIKTGIVSVAPIFDNNGRCTNLIGSVHDISERINAEKEIKESERKYRTLFENNTAGVYVSNIDGKILDCNQAFVDIMGYSSKEEVLNTDAINFHQNKEERERFLKKLKANKKLINFESKSKKKDSTLICTIENVQLIGENILQGTVLDITELKNIEIELKLSNDFNETLIETIPFGLDIVDMEGNVLFINNLLKDAIGVENPKGKCWDFYKDNHKQCTECPLKVEMEVGELDICEVHNVLGGREYEITHKVMNYKNKKAMMEIFKDITDEKNADKKIRQLSRGIEQSPGMIVITDLEGNIEYANKRVTEVTGYTQKELLGKNTRIFQSDKTPKIVYEELWNSIIKGKPWEGDILNKRKNGEEYWEHENISPILNDKDEIINYIAIKEDISEKIKTRNELIKAKEKAEEMNRLKSNFLANMSHELRTPLVGILGFTEILNESIEDEDLKEYAGMINEAGHRLLETLNLILNLSKIESEYIEIEYTKVEVIKIIKETIDLFKIIADNKKLYIELESYNEEIEINIDKRMLFQIVNNLVNNAVKFTKEGGVTIKVKKNRNNSLLEIKVIDTGIGIPKEKQDIIWQEFRQASEGTSRLYQGTGLGLTITERFVRKLGGEIKLKSKEGKGSTFTVLLPLNKNKKQITPSKKSQPKIQLVSTEQIIKKELLKVLLLEDNENARNLVTYFLSGMCMVDFALKVEEAIDKALNKKYDLFLVDINLKLNKGGVEFLNEIKKIEIYRDTPLIAVTAYAMADDEKKYLDQGFTAYLSKPFSKNNLIEIINRYS